MGLKDLFGRLFKETVKPETRELSAVSLAERWSTYPSAGLTPNRLAGIFREADQGNVYRQMELFEEMEEKDAHLTAILQTRKMAVLGKDYEVMPYAETPEDEGIAAQVGEIVYGIPNLEEAFLDLLDAIGKGFALSEIFWEVTGRPGPGGGTAVDSPEKGDLRGRLEAPAADAGGQLARDYTAGLEGYVPPLQGQKRPRQRGRECSGWWAGCTC